jgi:hypothetical protein
MTQESEFVAARGTQSSTFVIIPLPSEEAERLLPGELRLSWQDVTDAGTHPLLCAFGSQRNVHTDPLLKGGNLALVLPYLNTLNNQPPLEPLAIDYLEVITALPYVEWVQPRDMAPGPFVFAPKLYLDNLLPTVGGWLVGYAKEMCGMGGDRENFHVNRLVDDALLFAGSCQPQGDWRSPAAFPNFERIRPMLEQPVLGQTVDGHHVRTGFRYVLEDARMQAASATVQLTEHFFAGSLGPKNLPVGDIEHQRLGAFCMEVPWTLTPQILFSPG